MKNRVIITLIFLAIFIVFFVVVAILNGNKPKTLPIVQEEPVVEPVSGIDELRQ